MKGPAHGQTALDTKVEHPQPYMCMYSTEDIPSNYTGAFPIPDRKYRTHGSWWMMMMMMILFNALYWTH